LARENLWGIDWRKCLVINGIRVCVGVEIQFSARSDLVVIDIIHLRQALTAGEIDVGILVLPTDRLSIYLTDRGPSIATAKRHVLAARAEDLPLLLIALEHDGPSPPLAKQGKRASP
jgi:Restriction endonuclease BglII